MIGKYKIKHIFKKEIQFGSFKEYVRYYTLNGDWLLPLSDKISFKEEKDSNIDPCEFDDGLINPYRHQDDSIVLKNVKMIANVKKTNTSNIARFISNIFNNHSDDINNIPFANKFFKKFMEIYDDLMRDQDTGYSNRIHIWIPLWDTNPEFAMEYSICDRIFIVIT